MKFFTDISQKAVASFKRFPITLTWAVLGSFYLIGIYSVDDYKFIDNYTDVQLTLVLGVSWFIAVQFVSESLKHNVVFRFLLKLVVTSGLILFYFYIKSQDGDIASIAYGQWALLLLAGHVFLVFAPFLQTWNKNKFWDYLKSIIHAVLRSSLYALILFIGLAIAIFALEILFKVDFNSYIYLQTFIFSLGVVNTFVYLNDFPKLDELQNQVKLSKAGEVLILYILMPLSLLYLIIVYVYTLKILIDWELPEGWVTYLISALSLLAFIIHIAIEPVRKTHAFKLIQKFFPYYFYAILPLLPLLFIALYRRIADYNFTEWRYLGLVLAIWISGMLIYMLISTQKTLSLYAKSIFVLILLCTFGPLSAFKISLNAQVNELGELMQNLENKTEMSFSAEEFDQFGSIIRYISNRDAMNRTEAYFGFNPDVVFSESSSYNIPRKIVDYLKIEVDAFIENPNPYKTYNLYAFKPNYAEEITDFTHFTELKLESKIDMQKALLLHYSDKNIISFRYFDEVLFEMDMTTHLKTMADQYDNLNRASQDEFTFRFKNEQGDFLMIFDRLRYNYIDGKIKILSGHAKLFYRTYMGLELP